MANSDQTARSMVSLVLALPRSVKRGLVLLLDVVLCVVTVWLAFYLRLDDWIRLYDDPYWRGDWAAIVAVALAIPLFIRQGFYRVIFRHGSAIAIYLGLRAFALYALLYATIFTVVGVAGVPRSIGIIQPLLLLLAVGCSRALAHYWLGGAYQKLLKRAALPRALIYGAGDSGRQLAAAMRQSFELRVVGFLDDDAQLQGQVMHGLRIHNPDTLPTLVSEHDIHTVLLAMPSISRQRRNQILTTIQPLQVAVRSLPSVNDLARGKVTVSDLRELDIEDLLGREPVAPNLILMAQNIHGKVVLVTGAGGSIGSELCRQILALGPAQLILLDVSEFALYQIQQELQSPALKLAVPVHAVLASVRDANLMLQVFMQYRPDTVFHAAAYKHVPLVQDNPVEGLRNNTWGTWVTAQAAIEAKVRDFVLISTDKAVRPTNVMGASKRLAEMVLQALAQKLAVNPTPAQADSCETHPKEDVVTRLTMVRFGNVLGSSGSVVPLFRKQIRDGGPVTVTDAEVTRYFMTIPEAAQLVIQAGAMTKGGDVFVLEMGEPVKIHDLARRLIELSGLTVRDDNHPTGDIAIKIVGLRPGEKRYEELLIGSNPGPTEHARIMRAQEPFLPWDELMVKLGAIEAAMQGPDIERLHNEIKQVVPEYQPASMSTHTPENQTN